MAVIEQDPLESFFYALKSSEARRQYPRRFKMFLDYVGLEGVLEQQAKNFLLKARSDVQWAQDNFMRFLEYHKQKVRDGEKAAGTVVNYYRATKLFCEMNELDLRWKKISRGLPRTKKSSNDRAPTIEELRKLVEYPDRRIKSIIYSMASSGIRIGAWDYLRWKHVTPVYDEKDELIAAKLLVYAGEPEEYYSFMTPEAYQALENWMNFRSSYGEKITGESWLMRDLWQTTNINYGAKWGLATAPKKLHHLAVKRLIDRALWEQGIREKLEAGQKRHEWKEGHGYRKFFKTHAEQVMRPANVEILMGHDIGISESYWRPTERSVLEDYLKAVELLTISGDEKLLRKKIEYLNEKSKENNYVIEGKIAEKESEISALKQDNSLNSDAITRLSDKIDELMQRIQQLEKR